MRLRALPPTVWILWRWAVASTPRPDPPQPAAPSVGAPLTASASSPMNLCRIEPGVEDAGEGGKAALPQVWLSAGAR